MSTSRWNGRSFVEYFSPLAQDVARPLLRNGLHIRSVPPITRVKVEVPRPDRLIGHIAKQGNYRTAVYLQRTR